MPNNFIHTLDAYPDINYAYSCKENGNMSYSKGDAVEVTANRAALAVDMSINAGDFMTFPHTGSNNILIVGQNDVIEKDDRNYYQSGGKVICNTGSAIYRHPLLEEGFDAVVSNKRDFFPLLIVGDCVGAQLIDIVNHSFAVVHAGLSGCINNIVPHTLEAMSVNYGSKPENIRAILPPSIRECHYQVERLPIYQSSPVQQLLRGDTRHAIAGHYNLHAVIKDQLLDFGVVKTHIHDTELCTACHNQQFYSNFIAGKNGTQSTEGRFASTIGIKSPR